MLNIRGYFNFDPSLKNELSLNFSFWFESKSWGTVISYHFLTITPNWKYLHKLSHLYVETELILADVENLFLFYARECKNAAQRNYWMSEKNFSWQLYNVTIFAPVKLAGIVRITLICLGICELGNLHQSAFFQNISA